MFQTFSYQLLEQLAGVSIRSLFLAALIVVIIFGLRLRHAPIQHGLWTVLLFSMLVLPVVSITLPAIHLSLPALRLPFSGVSQPSPPFPAVTRVHRTEPMAIEVRSGTVVYSSPEKESLSPVWPLLLVGAYFAGALILFLRLCVGLALMERLVATSAIIRNSKANDFLEELATTLLAEYPLPRLCESAQISAPVVVGGEGVSILLPPSWGEWDGQKLQAVLAHEMTHVRRGDWLLVAVAAFNRCVFWFHPLAWWLGRRLACLSEEASDDAAVRIMGDPAVYAGMLLEVSAVAGPNRFVHRGLSPLSMAALHGVSRRIQRLLEVRNPSSGVLSRSAWTAIVACAVPLVSAIAAAQLFRQPAQIEGDVSASWEWQNEGFKTSAEEAKKLEAQLAANPDNLTARAKLIAYYLYNVMPEQLGRHNLWIIERHPDSYLAGSTPVIGLYAPVGDAHLERVRQLWLRQAVTHHSDPRVLRNAAQFLMQVDPMAAEGPLKRALELDPENPERSSQLANFYTQAIRENCYRRVGLKLPGPWESIDPAYPPKVKDQLDRLQNARLLGLVGSSLASSIVDTRQMWIDFQPQIDEARTMMADYAEALLLRAQSLDPENSAWAESLRRLRNYSRNNADAGGLRNRARETPPVDLDSSHRIWVAGTDQARQLVESAPAVYPPLAQQARIQGSVRLQVIIGPEGRIMSTKVIHGHPLLVPAALDAVKGWSYKPTLVDGQPVEVGTEVEVNFTLSP